MEIEGRAGVGVVSIISPSKSCRLVRVQHPNLFSDTIAPHFARDFHARCYHGPDCPKRVIMPDGWRQLWCQSNHWLNPLGNCVERPLPRYQDPHRARQSREFNTWPRSNVAARLMRVRSLSTVICRLDLARLNFREIGVGQYISIDEEYIVRPLIRALR